MPQHADLAGMREVGAEPREVQVGEDQLEEDVTLAEEEERELLAEDSSGDAEVRQQRPRVLSHGECGSDLSRAGPRHQLAVGRVVVPGVQVEVDEALLRFAHPVEVVRLAIVGEARRSPWTVEKELGHASRDMLEDVYGRLGEMRHRSEAVEFRVEQHFDWDGRVWNPKVKARSAPPARAISPAA